jgi:hypothetical protein
MSPVPGTPWIKGSWVPDPVRCDVPGIDPRQSSTVGDIQGGRKVTTQGLSLAVAAAVSSGSWLYSVDVSHAPRNDVSVNNGPHIRRRSHNNIIIYYNTYHCVTIAYSIQYSNMLYRFVA